MIFSRCTFAARASCNRALTAATTASAAGLRQHQRMFWSSRMAKDGTLEMVLGAGIITLAVIDRVLVAQQTQDRNLIKNRLRSDHMTYHNSAEQENWDSLPPMFDCIVRKKASNLDGFKCLTGVEVGDTVQVLLEQVGPGKMYNVCRKVDDEGQVLSVGWFPTQLLEKL